MNHTSFKGWIYLIALSVETTLKRIFPGALFVPTRSGAIARSIAQFRSPGVDNGCEFAGNDLPATPILLWSLPGS